MAAIDIDLPRRPSAIRSSRDRAQALAVASALVERMPHLKFSPDELRSFPKEMIGAGDESELGRLARSFGIDLWNYSLGAVKLRYQSSQHKAAL